MEYKVLSSSDIEYFQNLIGEKNVLTSDFEVYCYDSTENLHFPPDVVLKPETAEQIAQIVKYCYENLLPITPRGAGTGLAGGALAVKGGVLLSVEKLNSILGIDTKNLQATVEAGVINYQLQQELAEHQLFYPPDPSSWQSSFIGGNIATNAGGPKAVKYGVTAHYVLNLEVVLPNGEIIWTGANTLKNSTGLNLTQLFVGSEGTLGIITKAVLKLIPIPENEITILVPFYNIQDACDAVSALFYAGVLPSTLEFMEQRAIEVAIKFLNEVNIQVEDGIEAHLIISLDDKIEEGLEKCMGVLEKFNIGEILFADNEIDKNRLWQIRRKVAEIVKMNGYTIEEDTVVPRANLAQLVTEVHRLADENQFKVVCYGHAGDGNLHIRINHPQHKNSYNVPEIQQIINQLFGIVKNLGGTLSGEHGIGLIQQNYLPLVFSNAQIELQKAIKRAVDEKNIMNPGKLLL